MQKIIYLKLWEADNIGNGFINLGSIISLSEAINDRAILIPISLHCYLVSNITKFVILTQSFPTLSQILFKVAKVLPYKVKRKFIFEALKSESIVQNYPILLDIIKADYVVISGAILGIGEVKLLSNLLIKLKDRGSKIIFYGVGGYEYTEKEVETVYNFLERVKPYAFISRDRTAFKIYNGVAEYSYDGICPAFFVNKLEILNKFSLKNQNYYTFVFDNPKNIYKTEEIIRKYNLNPSTVIELSHSPIPQFSLASKYRKKFVSDSVLDYLILYKYTSGTFTDRIHAAVATLAFGRPCRLYTESKRVGVLKRVGADNVLEDLECADVEKISKEQLRQVNFLKEIL